MRPRVNRGRGWRDASAVSAYAANIDNLGVLSKAVEKMATTHVRVKVKPEHYPLVGVSLLGAIKDVLGDAATDEVIEAWQYLHDTKLAYKLQGWFGRTAKNLLDAGVITDTNEQNDKLIERMRKASDW